jgi:large subunit ribosomal protein L31
LSIQIPNQTGNKNFQHHKTMKKGIHPDYKEITVLLSDGTEIKTRSTMNVKDGVYKSEVDSKNHPFYNKNQKIQKKAGRIDRFNKRYKKK